MLGEFTEDADFPVEDVESAELSQVLLDPEAWRKVLGTYAGTMRLAVALVNPEGVLLGECLNPQPIWKMTRGAEAAVTGAEATESNECPFCLAPIEPCHAVADAIRTASVVLVEDQAGLAHVAIPLLLGGQPLGALIAGQVLSRYPEPLRLQRVAREFEIFPQAMWQAALQQVPLKPATLRVYGELLLLFGESYVGTRYAAVLRERLVATNQEIRRGLREKEVLLQEVHHRVKNNLTIVSSLLNMQATRLDELKDAAAVSALESSQQRIQAMAQIHDLLLGDTQVLGEIDLGQYLKRLVEMVLSSSQSEGKIHIHSHFELTPTLTGMRQAVPCGLIVNELVTNVLKYAYPKGQEGYIRVRVALGDGDRITLAVADDGVGFPEGSDWEHSNSLGLKIIRILVKQIGGTFTMDFQHGVSTIVEFTRKM